MRDFSDYIFHYLKNELAGINLMAIDDPDEFFYKQILDSIEPLKESVSFFQAIDKAGLVIDVGFGGGLPLLPLAYTLPHIQFLGIEARRKKVYGVQSLIRSLTLKNVICHHIRLEDLWIDKAAVLTFKAVGKVVDLLPKIRGTKDVCAFFYKGPHLFKLENISSLSSTEMGKNWKQIENKSYEIPHAEGRILIGFRGQNVPRGTLKKVSQILE